MGEMELENRVYEDFCEIAEFGKTIGVNGADRN